MNFPRVLGGTMQTFTVSGDAPADQAVLVSHRAARYKSFDVVGARMNGEAIAPSYSDGTVVAFVAPERRGDGTSVHWDIDIKATPEYVDVVTFRSAPLIGMEKFATCEFQLRNHTNLYAIGPCPVN